MRRAALAAAALGGLLPLASAASAAPGAALLVEREFESAIKTVSPATVYCVAPARLGVQAGSSGVVVTRDGYVLSDYDAGLYRKAAAGGQGGGEVVRSDVVEVRVPDLKRGTYDVYTAKVVRRVQAIDSTLLKIEKPPTSGLPFVVPRSSAGLDVGQFTFAVGTSFPSEGAGADSSVTAGVVASLVPLEDGGAAGPWAEVYTSAAVNVGVNGGPLVDADGSLVGVISTWGQLTPTEPHQFLGKAFPMDRIRAAYADLKEASAVFPSGKGPSTRSKQAALLEEAFAAAAAKAHPSVVSLVAERDAPLRMYSPPPLQPGARRRVVESVRYSGPTSGVVVARDGWIVASLHGFADTLSLARPETRELHKRTVADDLAMIRSLTAVFSDGTETAARVVAHDQMLGVVLVKATLPPGFDAVVPEAAPEDASRPGSIVLNVASPFGRGRRPRPLVAMGVVSRRHPEDGGEAWSGALQTDANMTDATVGGAIVDVRGRVLGVGTIWYPAQHGRNSGIGFVVPWDRVQAALPGLRAGQDVVRGHTVMGVLLGNDLKGSPVVSGLSPGGPAERAGVRAGDRLVAIDGAPIGHLGALRRALWSRRPGDRVKLTVERDGKRVDLDLTLAAPPAETPETPSPSPPVTPTPKGAPGMGEPGMDEPGMGEPGMGEPGMDDPGMGDPGMDEPGMGEPSPPAMDEPAPR